MGADDLLRKSSNHFAEEGDHQRFGGELERHEGGWHQGQEQEPGADQDLRRSEQAAALNELLLESGLHQGSVDALLQGDTYSDLLAPSSDEIRSETPPPSLSRSLVVIDQSVDNWRELAVSAPNDADVLVLDQQQDGISQISEHFAQQHVEESNPYSNLLIVCQGREGQLQLGDDAVGAGELKNHTTQLSVWKAGLADNAEISVFDGIVDHNNETDAIHETLAELSGIGVVDGDETVAGGIDAAWNATVTTSAQTTAEEESAAPASTGFFEHFRTVNEERLDSLEAYATWQEALQQTNQILTELPKQDDFQFIIEETFGQAGTEQQQFDSRFNALETNLKNGGLGITVELLSGDELKGARGAYTSSSPNDGQERIYLNSDWISQGATSLAIALVLLEESGHSLDFRLNNHLDSEGDEGEAFARKVIEKRSERHRATNNNADGLSLELASPKHISESSDDQGTITIDGTTISVEFSDSVAISNTDEGNIKERNTHTDC